MYDYDGIWSRMVMVLRPIFHSNRYCLFPLPCKEPLIFSQELSRFRVILRVSHSKRGYRI